MRQKDIRPAPARIEFKGMKFLITDRPSDATIQSYLMVSSQLTLTQPVFSNFCLRSWEFDDLAEFSLIVRSRSLD